MLLATLPDAAQVAGNAGAALVVLFAMIVGHALGDYALQSDFLAKAKTRRGDLSASFPNGRPWGLWGNALLAHAVIHAGAVWLLTGSVILGLIEWVLHTVIDLVKGEEKISFEVDQALHILCKLVYAVLLYQGYAWVTWSPV
ncbi:MAG: DUF3307 domain-containing protein [Akkermansiaceae bacterium]|nr:DUF3307 domain-containing protein [Akkermansiaceae bacterium]NNM30787.1 DUF3307 domain-containing protein [Akkermansiaceae bacterium]